ncbi:MAG: hypothetical protein KIY12_10315, partial [Thermoplasmata archaeon]|nr:hypothetical protein [Candidatus Sysuiplasma superficiale]
MDKTGVDKLVRIAGTFVAALFVMSALFGGIAPVSHTAGAVAAAVPSQQGGNVTVGSGYSLTSWNLSGGTQVMLGNLTIKEGGVVRLT